MKNFQHYKLSNSFFLVGNYVLLLKKLKTETRITLSKATERSEIYLFEPQLYKWQKQEKFFTCCLLQVVPYKECKSGQEPQQFTETKLAAKKFIEQGCTQGKKTIPHTKLLPECRNVTKQNCVTLWETDANGKQVQSKFWCLQKFCKILEHCESNCWPFDQLLPQVWAGTDACEPVTWQECKLVPKDVKFIVPEIKCEPKQELWYHEPEEVM